MLRFVLEADKKMLSSAGSKQWSESTDDVNPAVMPSSMGPTEGGNDT